MTAVLKQMDDGHYAHHVSTFKTRQDIIVSVPRPLQWVGEDGARIIA